MSDTPRTVKAAEAPETITAETTADRPVAPIVVGVDGSPPSIAALRWAVEQARLTGAALVAVTGWEVPATIMVVPTYTEGDYARDAHRIQDRAIAAVRPDEPDVVITTQLVQKNAALALVHAAAGAQLLVVGSHGSGKLPGMHLGSVATYCMHHAPCPVVVVRDPTGGPTGGRA